MKMAVKLMAEYDIKKTLRSCKRAARNGYSLSIKQYKSLDETMGVSRDEIKNALLEIGSSECYVSEATDSLSEQLRQTQELLGYLSASLHNDLIELKEKMSVFSITLFGKTMAGKSTLMEVLTEGNGESIGKGAQRTTRDVRSYKWNDLEITDVPGIGAFEGEEDEDIAFNAAQKADLILFLITDDAPQSSEAECLSRIIELGKPVICVLNVKSSIRENESPKMTLRNIEKAFDNDRLETIKKQFMDFAKLDGEIWDDIPVVSVHLKSAFMSQKEKDESFAKSLLEASHINELKEKIIEEVETHGKYYREKNFVDIVSVSSLDIFENLLFQSNTNKNLSVIVADKEKQLEDWKEKYERDSKNEIDSLIFKLDSELRSEIPEFVDEHYDDKDADEAWKQLIVEKQIEERAKGLANKIIESADNRLKELERSLACELQYISNLCNERKMSIPKMHKIINAKKIWGWGSLVVNAGVDVLLLTGVISGPIGWIVAGGTVLVGIIGSFIIKNIGKKEERARKQLEQNLIKNITEICDTYKKQLDSVLTQVINERINPKISELGRIISLIDYLSVAQNSLAVKIQPNLLEQGRQVLIAALKLIWGGIYAGKISKSARVPGKILIAQLEENKKIPDKKMDKLKALMQEELYFIESTSDSTGLINSIIGDSGIEWNYDNGIIHINQSNLNAGLVNRLKILQQFLGIYIEGAGN